MKCGIVVLNYNDYEGTYEFINQIKDYKIISKIVIVDNFSNDESVEKLKVLCNKRIKLIEAKCNKGYAAGNNLGIRYLIEKCNLDYVIVSNPDVIIQEKAINKCLSFLEKNSEYALASVTMIEKNNSKTSRAWKLPNYCQCLLLSLPLLYNIADNKINYPIEHFQKEVSDVEVVPGSFFVARSKYIKKIGYMDERTFLYCEENILGYKLKINRYKAAIINTENYIHNHSVTINKSIENKINKFIILNSSRLVYLENYLKINKSKILFFHLISNTGILIRRLIYFFEKIYLKIINTR